MKHYVVSYSSQNNAFKGTAHVEATGVVEAQDKFLEWVRKQPSYTHLWQLSFEFKEIGASL
jgi:hypothetical protein